MASFHIMQHMFNRRGYKMQKVEDVYYAELVINEPK